MNSDFDSLIYAVDKSNSSIDSNWRENLYRWDRAIWMECGKLVSELAFKDWSACSKRYEGIRKILLIILFYVVSDACTVFSNKSLNKIMREKMTKVVVHEDIENVREAVEDLAAICLCPTIIEHRELNIEAKIELVFTIWYSLFQDREVISNG